MPEFIHDEGCNVNRSVVSDQIHEQIVSEYLKTANGRRKLVDSLEGVINHSLRDANSLGVYPCGGCRARFCTTWIRCFLLMQPEEWDQRAHDLYRIVQQRVVERNQEIAGWEQNGLSSRPPPVEVDRLPWTEHLMLDILRDAEPDR